MLDSLRVQSSLFAARIYLADGTPLATYRRAGETFDPPAVGSAGTRFVGHSLLVFRPIMLDGETIGTVFVASGLEVCGSRPTGPRSLAASWWPVCSR